MRRCVAQGIFVLGSIAWVSLLLGAAVVHVQGGGLYWNTGMSLPPGLYRCWAPGAALEPGMLVAFRPAPAHYAMVQQAYGTQAVPAVWMKQVIRWDGEEVWVQGTHPRSWDSRHFGPIPRERITGTCAAVWVPEGAIQ